MRSIIQKMSKRELPGITPFRVHEHFINSFVCKWEEICLYAFSQVEEILKNAVVEVLCTKHFWRFRSSGLLVAVTYAPFPSKLTPASLRMRCWKFLQKRHGKPLSHIVKWNCTVHSH